MPLRYSHRPLRLPSGDPGLATEDMVASEEAMVAMADMAAMAAMEAINNNLKVITHGQHHKSPQNLLLTSQVGTTSISNTRPPGDSTSPPTATITSWRFAILTPLMCRSFS